MAAGDDIQDNKLRDLLIDRMREAGIDVVTDVEEGERVLARAGETAKVGINRRGSDDIRYQIKEETVDDKNNMNEKLNEILVPVMTGKEKTELPREGGLCELSDVLSGEITRQDVDRALDSHLVKSWMKAKGQAPSARLGIDNKFDACGNVFHNSWEVVEQYMKAAKRNGLDAAIADKYDLHCGSEDVRRIMEHPEAMYSEREISEIGKFLKPGGFEDFKAAVRSFSEDKLIREEEQRIRQYDHGDALTKAFVLYDIAQRRLFAGHLGDERWFRRSEYIMKADGTTAYGGINQKPKEGETLTWKWVLKKSAAKEMMHLIATSPITEQVPLLEKGREQQRVSDVTVHTMKDGKAFVKCKIDGRQQLRKPVKDKDLANYGNVALAEKYFAEELRKNRENKRTIKR
nr:hypothetical protein [Clostridia bacterium]